MPYQASSPETRFRLRWWILLVASGEALGFAIPAAVGAVAADSEVFVPVLLAAGALEGAVLGASQAMVLRRILPPINSAAWIALTSAGAVVAYAIGLAPSTFAEVWTGWPWPAQALVAALLTVALLGCIGAAQWLLLRRHLRASGWWIVGTAVGWLVGLGVFLAVAPPLWHEGQPVGTAILIGVAAGVLMAAAMATVTGLTLVALLKRQLR